MFFAKASSRAAKLLHAALSGRSKPNAQLSALARSYGSKEDESGILQIDRSGLFQAHDHGHGPLQHKEAETELTKLLKALIRFRGGPISLAEYMSEALTNSSAGYYMRRDVFGKKGDFITSPEISQLFGEMIGIWCMLQWVQLGSPSRLHLVELGPGRGTLMADLLRGLGPFGDFTKAVNVHLVEVSQALREVQRRSLQCSSTAEQQEGEPLTTGLAHSQVHWHQSLADVPTDAPAIFIGNEFLDALPVHQFQKTERGWCERLVDVAPAQSQLHFQMVLSPGATPASKLLVPRRLDGLPPVQRESVRELEVSPQSIATAEALAGRIETQGGAALLIDYGQDSPYPGSLQAIRHHQFIHFLSCPGDADLSCRVDFSALKQGVLQSKKTVRAHGLLEQGEFLAALGIEHRMAALLKRAPQEQHDALIAGYNRITGADYDGRREAAASAAAEPDVSAAAVSAAEDDLGSAYKVLAITRDDHTPYPFQGSGCVYE